MGLVEEFRQFLEIRQEKGTSRVTRMGKCRDDTDEQVRRSSKAVEMVCVSLDGLGRPSYLIALTPALSHGEREMSGNFQHGP